MIQLSAPRIVYRPKFQLFNVYSMVKSTVPAVQGEKSDFIWTESIQGLKVIVSFCGKGIQSIPL